MSVTQAARLKRLAWLHSVLHQDHLELGFFGRFDRTAGGAGQPTLDLLKGDDVTRGYLHLHGVQDVVDSLVPLRMAVKTIGAACSGSGRRCAL